jgi:uncharacterized protein
MTDRQPVAVWFEIPATEFDRAARFYEAILGVSLRREEMGPMTLGVFPYAEPETSGCVMAGPGVAPGAGGTILYLNTGGRLREVLAATPDAGGRVVLPVTELPEGMGRFAHIVDTEGNRVGLHEAA